MLHTLIKKIIEKLTIRRNAHGKTVTFHHPWLRRNFAERIALFSGTKNWQLCRNIWSGVAGIMIRDTKLS